MEKVPISRRGYQRLQSELAHLRSVVRPAVIEDLQEARSYGVKVDNQQYLAARERHAVVQKRICDLERKLLECEVFAGRKYRVKAVGFGTVAAFENIDTGERHHYELVGPYESDIPRGRLSIDSPVGQCLLGKFEGESILVRTPAGTRAYRLLSIDV